MTALLASLGSQALELRGNWQQGSVLIGRVEPGTRVWFGGRELKVSPAGDFVFGLDRDQKPQAELRVQAAGEKKPQTLRYEVQARAWDVQRVDGLPPDKVDPPASAMARIRREQNLLGAAFRRNSDRTDFTQAMVWPAQGRISGVFGSQRILNGQPKRPHFGVDVAVPTGTPVVAPASGVVSLAHPDMYFTGGTVIVDHGHGLSSIMVHLSKLLVREGDVVQQGQTLAESGATGRASGPHLHWGVRWFSAYVDAATLVPPMPVPEVGGEAR